MFKAFKFAMKYRALLPVIIELVTFIQAATADSKLSNPQKSKGMSLFWKLVHETEALNRAK